VLCALLGLLAACESATEPNPATVVTPPGEWATLIEADWTLPPGSEAFICALHTVQSDVFIQAFRADAPEGTHHTVLTVTEPHESDGVFPCDPGTLSDAMIFASGFGTDDLAFPDGVAIRVPAGKQLLLNLHLVNPYPTPLSGRSGTQVQTIQPEEVDAEAEVVFAGTVNFAIPPNSEGSATGHCEFDQDATLLSLWPHMHQHGRHMVIEHHSDIETTTLHDEPFRFFHQVNKRIEPRVVRAGDQIDVTCTWHNTSDETVVYGDTANKEMCYAGLYRYPASRNGLYCDMAPR